MDKILEKELYIEKSKLISEAGKINSISSYLAMFPISLPEALIKLYSEEKDLIMDNFSGRGTTALASRFLNRKFVGNDLNPYSFVLTKFKISKLKKEKIFQRIQCLEKQYNQEKEKITIQSNDEMLVYYHKSTLKQLLFLRALIGKNERTTMK